MTAPENIRLGYLLITTPMPNLYIGGAMVTDGRGLPIEFRYTEPIQPTKIQQILYGQVLSRYIKREVILETLLKSLDSPFPFLLVEDDNLLTNTGKNYTMVRISQTNTPKIGKPGDIQELGASEILLQVSKEGSPLRLQLPDINPEGAPIGLPERTGGTAVQSAPTVYNTLIEAGRTMDLYEPLKRIEKALETICQEAGINSSLSAAD